jgi:lipid II:glycine glycyltransferase (peptidoglycan interpeptide bridge formation enzyme)
MLGAFFDLLVMTRRRHGIPPQPLGWFRNLAEAFGERLTIYTASVGGRPIASIMTLEHRDAMVYKYGASDARYHNLGGMASLFWEAIGDARAAGCGEFDLGRADLTNPGLILFKDRLGARQVPLRYWRYEARPAARVLEDAPFRLPERLVAAVPDRMLCLAGRVLYRHMG